jgi:TetR/AcrR family transcriptional regulator, transcriptional repressor of bet genes
LESWVPKQVDHRERRGRIAEALWTVAERDGIAAATVRHVAAEAGVSVGMVQHYFSSKDEMLLFALQWVGEEFGARITERVGALPEPRDPYEVVRIVLSARLPLDPRARVYVQALVAWLGRAIANPELARYMLEGTRVLRDGLAAQLRLAQQAGRVPARFDPVRTADGLLAFADGLSSHLLQDLHTPDEALAVLDEYLARLFEPG